MLLGKFKATLALILTGNDPRLAFYEKITIETSTV